MNDRIAYWNHVTHPITNEPIAPQTTESICQFHPDTGAVFCGKPSLVRHSSQTGVWTTIAIFAVLVVVFSLSIEFVSETAHSAMVMPMIDPAFGWLVIPAAMGAGIFLRRLADRPISHF